VFIFCVFTETKGRKKRKPYTRYQSMVLENEFLNSSYITRQKRWEISCKLQLTERQSKCGFKIGEWRGKSWMKEPKRGWGTTQILKIIIITQRQVKVILYKH